MNKLNRSSIERARAMFRGNEFGGSQQKRPSPWPALLWLWALGIFVALVALAFAGCTTEEITPAEAQAMHQAFNSPACRLHKSTEARMQCAIDTTQGV